jgi:sterol desaturase/sphingolipid hydroxylase (fatty acid hydroxylase superfamily)
MNLALALVFGLTCGTLALLFLGWAASTPRFEAYRISDDPHRAIDLKTAYRIAAKNAIFSAALIFSTAFALQGFLFREGPVALWRAGLEAVAVILIYDFLYYFMHRFLLHEWKVLRPAHAVHHAAQNPRVVDALLLHPVETFLGLATLFASILIVGGIHLYTFAPILAAYTTLNIFNHAGVALPWFPFETIGRLAIAHEDPGDVR